MEPKKVESLQTKIINSLRDHVTYNPEAQRKPQYFTRILDKLQVLRRGKYRGTFFYPRAVLGAEEPQSAGAAKDFLSEAGGTRSGATHH